MRDAVLEALTLLERQASAVAREVVVLRQAISVLRVQVRDTPLYESYERCYQDMSELADYLIAHGHVDRKHQYDRTIDVVISLLEHPVALIHVPPMERIVP